jgi:MFS family permease
LNVLEIIVNNRPPASSATPDAAALRAPVKRMPRTFRSLQHRNFQLYFAGHLISMAGTWMQVVAQAWLVYELSHSELMLGVVGFAAAIPSLLISPWGGVVVDQVNKRNLLVVTQKLGDDVDFHLAFLTLQGSCKCGRSSCWPLLSLVSLDGPARQAFVVEMVGREDLPNAIALNSMMFNGARVIGPALGGILLATVGPAWCFLLNGISFLAVIVCLLLMRLTPRTRVLEIGRRDGSQARRVTCWSTAKSCAADARVIFTSLLHTTRSARFVDQTCTPMRPAMARCPSAWGGGWRLHGALWRTRQRGRWLINDLWLFRSFCWRSHKRRFSLALRWPLARALVMPTFTIINTLLQTKVDDQMRDAMDLH